MNTKIYYYLIGWLVLGIFSILAFQNTPSQIKDTTIPVVIDTWAIIDTWIIDSWSLVTWTQNNSLVYTNTEYGFQLTLPEGWEEYRVFTYTGTGVDSWISISIALPTIDKTRYGVIDPSDKSSFIPWYTGQYKFIKWYADMLWISILTYEWYNTLINTPHVMYTKEMREKSVIWRTEKFVYMLGEGPNDWPIDIYQKKKERDSQWRGNYFQKIQSTFKIL